MRKPPPRHAGDARPRGISGDSAPPRAPRDFHAPRRHLREARVGAVPGDPPPRAGAPPTDRARPRRPGRFERPGHAREDLIFGAEPLRELIAAAPGAVLRLYVKAGAEVRFAAQIAAVRAHGASVLAADDEALARMAGSEARHQGVVALVREYQYAAIEDVIAAGRDPLMVVDGVTDPRNLGAIIRAAECAGAGAAIVARDRTVGVTPAAIKASAGAWAHLPIARCGNVAQAIEALKRAGYWVVALAPGGDLTIYDLDATRRLAFVVGSEGSGVREIVRKRADFVARIPMRGRIGSLNVSVAAAIALFEVARRRAASSVPAS